MERFVSILKKNVSVLTALVQEQAKRSVLAGESESSGLIGQTMEGLNAAIQEAFADGKGVPEPDSSESFTNNPVAAFGRDEAMRYHGLHARYHLSLIFIKICRKAFCRLIDGEKLEPNLNREYHGRLQRSVDCFEVAFSAEWMRALEENTWVRAVLKSSPLPLVLSELETGEILFASDKFFEMFKIDPKNSSSLKATDFYVNPHDRLQLVSDVRRKGEIREREIYSKKFDGERIWLLMSGVVAKYLDKDALVVVLQDITQKKKMEGERILLTNAIEGSPASVVITDRNGIIEYVNKKFCNITGYSKEEVVGKNPRILKSGRQSLAVYEELWKKITDGEMWSGEFCNKTKDGKEYWESATIKPIVDANKKITHFVALKEDITEKRIAEKALRESEERFRSLLNGLKAGVIVHNQDTSIELFNPRACELLGIKPQQMLGKVAHDPDWHFVDESGQRMEVQEYPVVRMLDEETTIDGLVLGVVHSEGEEPAWVQVDAFREHDAQGELKAIVVHFWDISERIKLEEGLRRSGEQFRLVFENANTGMCLVSVRGFFLVVNRTMERMLGYPDGALAGKHFDDVTYPEDLEIGAEYLKRAMAGKMDSLHTEKRYVRSDGKVLTCLVSSTVMRDDSGNPEFFLAHLVDITARKNARAELNKSRKWLAEAQRIAKVGSWVLDLTTGIFEWSQEMYRLYEVDSNEFRPTTESVAAFVHEDDREILQECLTSTMERDALYSVEYRLRLPGDEVKIVHCRGEVEYDEGRPARLKGTAQDITERKQAEREIRENETFLFTVLQSIGAAIFMVQPGVLAIESMNERAMELVGPGADELIGKSANSLCWQDYDGNCTLGLSLLHEGEEEEFVLIRPDGTRVPVTRTIVNVEVKGNVRHVLIVFDITERKALERQLNLAQKLEAIGSLAAGIAHEINTPIQYLSSNMTFLENAFVEIENRVKVCSSAEDSCFTSLEEHMEEIPAAISDCQQGIARVSMIVQGMRKFSHPDTGEPQPVDMNDVLSNTVTITRNEWKYVADMESDLADGLPFVRCAPGDLGQVFLNVLVNAAQAIAEQVSDSHGKGKIRVESRLDEDFVEARISDTGGGVPKEYQDKIFDPFFTTKEVGKGTGQGLAISHSILERFSGTIRFETEEGVGTTFIVRLPVMDFDMGGV